MIPEQKLRKLNSLPTLSFQTLLFIQILLFTNIYIYIYIYIYILYIAADQKHHLGASWRRQGTCRGQGTL